MLVNYLDNTEREYIMKKYDENKKFKIRFYIRILILIILILLVLLTSFKTGRKFYLLKKSFKILAVNIRAPASFICPQDEKYLSSCTTFS